MPSPALTSFFTPRRSAWLGLLTVTVLGYCTYMHNYAYPAQFFWDENYHVASAQKYLHGVFFMEPHPPLGKLLIAAGEAILQPNERTDQFLGTDYAGGAGMNFSFAGYRFFPALLAWLAAPLIFGIFLLLSRNALHATLLSFLYVFDNALIVHLRGAMLEGPLVFFSVLSVLAFLLFLEWKNDERKRMLAAVGFGAAVAAAVTVKVFALIFLLPALIAMFVLRHHPRAMFQVGGAALAAFIVVFAGVWQIHFSIASHVNPNLPDDGYYQASDSLKALLNAGRASSIAAFPLQLKDHMNFVSHYQRGVPELDLCKADENGSPFFLWPVGARAISYRWETPGNDLYQYLYLQVNPVVWGAGLLSVILAVGLLCGAWFTDIQRLRPPVALLAFLAMYGGFLAAVSRITRVMYLYHYFLPLLFTLFMLPLVLGMVRRFGPWHVTATARTGVLAALALLTFIGFQFYRPLSYYEPIDAASFQRRALLSIWELHCVGCDYQRTFGVPAAPADDE